MNESRILIIVFIFFVLSCKEKESSLNPQLDAPQYQQEELIVYNQLIDVLLDSVGFSKVPEGKLVFYLGDTLAGQGNNAKESDLLAGDLKTRSFAIGEFKNSAHKYIRATDTLRLDPGDAFTSRWLNLTRIRFNKDMTNGSLRVGVWCGNMCSWEMSFRIRKEAGQWKVVDKSDGPPA